MKKNILSRKLLPISLLVAGAIIISIGAIAKIEKSDFASTLLLIGLILEGIGAISIILIETSKKKEKNIKA